MTARPNRSNRVITLLENNARSLLRYLERRVGADDAQDALSETMTTVWRRASSIPDDDDGARLWMFGVARNVVLNTTRGQRRRTLLTERLRHVVYSAPEVDPVSEDVLDVRAALLKLSPDLAEIVRLVHWDGFSISETAQIMGLPDSTARSRYGRAKRHLADALATHHATT
ncbi:sigma-70 family RNA polymerase sigma factor [Microbacterium oleivorans]|uniref:RNA polymerase sigma factor n=1 Tax=Microbacterium oleivorans TaxID=273677 RepID=UPI0033CBA91A